MHQDRGRGGGGYSRQIIAFGAEELVLLRHLALASVMKVRLVPAIMKSSVHFGNSAV